MSPTDRGSYQTDNQTRGTKDRLQQSLSVPSGQSRRPVTRFTGLRRWRNIHSMQPSPIVYLMRGLPGCGKSHRAKRLAGEQGIVCETDEYFYSQVGTDPGQYDYDDALLPAAREWNLARFRDAVLAGVSPIVVDRGNGLNRETREYATFAVARGYIGELAERDSSWWQEHRVLLKYQH